MQRRHAPPAAGLCRGRAPPQLRRAAEELHLTPPAVSMQIKELEEQVGLPLFDRGGRSVALTAPASTSWCYARKILATLKDAEDAMARLSGLQTGRLTIGMVSTAKYFVPRLLARFRESIRASRCAWRSAQPRAAGRTCCRPTRSTWRSWGGRRASSPRAPSRSPRTRL